MPPKIKVTEEEILDAAIEITRKKGIAGVNARELAKLLGCSVQPIFRGFQNMGQLKKELYRKAESIFDGYMRRGMERHEIPFLGMGLAYVAFAREEKNLFKFLFMSDGFKGKSIFDLIKDDENQEIIRMIAGMTGLDMKNAEQLFGSMWLMSHGIASMIAASACDFNEKQIAGLLTDSFLGLKYRLGQQKENMR